MFWKYDIAKTSIGEVEAVLKGAHVANALTVDAGIGVSKIYTKSALRDATGHAKAFREAFTKIDCLINYLSTIPQIPVSITEVTGPNEEDARYHVNLEKCTCGCTYWKSIGIACKHAMAVWEMYQSQLKATGEEISQAWHNAARQTRRGICRTARYPGPTCDYYES